MANVSVKRTLIVLSRCVLVLAVGVLVAYQLYFSYILSNIEKKLQPAFEKYKESITAENIQKTIAAVDAASTRFPAIASTRSADAGPYLNPKMPVEWRVTEEHKANLKAWHKPWPTIAEETTTAVAEATANLPIDVTALTKIPPATEPGAVNYNELDVTWFDDIQRFDYWSLEQNSPFAWASDEEYAQMGWIINVINFFHNIDATLLKQFVLHKEAGKLSEFSEKSTKLVSLLLSTEDVLMSVKADSVAQKTAELLRGEGVYSQPESLDNPQFSNIAMNVKNLMQPYAALQPMIDPLLAKQHPAICVGLHDWLRTAEILKSYVDLDDTYAARVDDIYNKHAGHCRFQRLREYRGKLKRQDKKEAATALPLGPKFINPRFAVVDLDSTLEAYFLSVMAQPLLSIASEK